jgi:replicative DNA helicase
MALLTPPAAIEADDFTEARHRILWHIITMLVDCGERIDFVTLSDELDRVGELERVGGMAFVGGLMNDRLLYHANPQQLKDRLRDYTLRRRALDAAQALSRDAFNAEKPIGEALNNAATNLREASPGDQGVEIRESANRVLARIEENIKNPIDLRTETRGINTGWANLNRALGGWYPQRGELSVVLGLPADGKTAFLWLALLNVAKTGRRVGIFSLEMSEDSLAERALLQAAGITPWEAESGHVPDDKLRRLYYWHSEIREYPISIYPSQNISEIIATMEREARGPDPVAMWGVDYLGLVKGDTGRSEMHYHLAEILRQLKLCALRLRTEIIVPHQMSDKRLRARPNALPQPGDSYGTSGPEQNADRLMAIWRPHRAGMSRPPSLSQEEFERLWILVVLKDRYGLGQGKKVPFWFTESAQLLDMRREDMVRIREAFMEQR